MARYRHDPDILHRSKTRFDAPLKWPAGRVFTCSWSDFWLKEADGLRSEAWAVMRKAPQHTYIIPTKRPENILDRLPDDWGEGWPNVWLLISAGTQESLDKWVPELLKIPAAVRGVSCEPLLEPIDNLWHYLATNSIYKAEFWNDSGSHKVIEHRNKTITATANDGTVYEDGLDLHWVIIGCESGPRRRQMSLAWARQIVRQCKHSRVPVFVKQLSINGKVSHVPSEWPKDLRIREYPKTIDSAEEMC